MSLPYRLLPNFDFYFSRLFSFWLLACAICRKSDSFHLALRFSFVQCAPLTIRALCWPRLTFCGFLQTARGLSSPRKFSFCGPQNTRRLYHLLPSCSQMGPSIQDALSKIFLASASFLSYRTTRGLPTKSFLFRAWLRRDESTRSTYLTSSHALFVGDATIARFDRYKSCRRSYSSLYKLFRKSFSLSKELTRDALSIAQSSNLGATYATINFKGSAA